MTCHVCHAESTAPLCKVCGDQVARALADMRSLMHEVSVVATKQARVYRANGRPVNDQHEHQEWDREQHRIPAWLRSREGRVALPSTQLVVNLDARELLWIAGNTLSTWARHIAGDGRDQPTTANLIEWLCEHVTAIRYDPAAEQIHDEITTLRKQLTRAVDRAPSRIYAGPCHAPLAGFTRCQRPLFAYPGSDEILCDGWTPDGSGSEYDIGCRATHTTESRKEWLIAELEDALAPLDVLRAAIPRLYPSLLMPADNTWSQWQTRKRLVARGVDRDGNELFRGGDVLTLALDAAVRTGPKRGHRAS